MSYEIVSRLRLEKNENGWYAVVKSCSNNVYPHWHEEWTYGKGKGFTKEQLQAEILLSFYHGNLKGAKNTKYGKFMSFLGMTGRIWGVNNENSRACRTYHFYDKLEDKLRNDYLKNDSTTGCWEQGTPKYERYCERNAKLNKRARRELKRYLLKEFNEFSDTCKPTIVRLWFKNYKTQNFEPSGLYCYNRYRDKKGFYRVDNYDMATRYTSRLRLENIKRICESNGYKAEFIQVK